MAAELRWAPEAGEDVDSAYAWYERSRPGLGEEFLAALDAAIERILRVPDMYAVVQSRYRRGLVDRFPYAVIYRYDDGVVTIYAVSHTSRDPETWRARFN